jgi:hypothetical protein
MKHTFLLLWFLIAGTQSIAWADTCPPPPSSVNPSVSTHATFDKKIGNYTFNYSVQSAQDSLIPIDSFMLYVSQSPVSSLSPTHWIPGFQEGVVGISPEFSWIAVRSSNFKPVSIAPGKGLSGFSIQSSQPPGPIQYFVDGQTGVPSSSPPTEGAADDEPTPNCPNWDFNSPRLQTLVTGLTTGPQNPNTISVAIRLRDETGTHVCGPINPISPSGKVSVLVLGSKDFDPTQVVVSSIKFGPNGAIPLSSKLVPAGGENIAPWDEHEEWEKLLKAIVPDCDNNPKKQNLLLVFDQASLGAQCVLDKAIFLSGQTQAGNNIVSGVSSRFVGCDIQHPGRRPPSRRGAGR